MTKKFNTIQDRLKITAYSLTGLAVFGAGLSTVFNPLAIAGAAGVAAVNYIRGQALAIPAYRDFAFNSMVKKGRSEIVSPDSRMGKMVAEISQQLGRKSAPKIYTIDEAFAVKMAAPFGMRWMVRPLVRKKMHTIFGAIPGANTFITTKEALNSGIGDGALRFIMAHEMSHMQSKDNLSLGSMASTIAKKSTRVLFWATAIAAGASLMGVGGLPAIATVSAAKAIGMLWATKFVADLGIKAAWRVVERRADRNAVVNITGDMDGAVQAFDYLTPLNERKSSLLRSIQTHPPYFQRIDALKTAFEAASVRKEANDNKPAMATSALKSKMSV